MDHPLIDFSWTPTAGQVSFSIGSDSYPPNDDVRYAASKTPISTLVTFTAEVLSNQQFIYYEWDFGDGDHGSGRSVSHLYPFITSEAQVSLTVTDAKRRSYRIEKMINLVLPTPTPPYYDLSRYVNTDLTDDTPTSILQIDSDTHQLTLEPRISGIKHTEVTTGFVFTPSYTSDPDVRVIQKVFTGHGAEGQIDTQQTDIQYSTQFGSCIKWQDNRQPGPDPIDMANTQGIFSWWDMAYGGLGLYYDLPGSTWNDFGDPDAIYIETGSLPWNTTLAEDITVHHSLSTYTTAFIAAGTLPSEIEVADTTGFASSGSGFISGGGGGPGGIVFDYTSITGVTFEGCTLRYGTIPAGGYNYGPANAHVTVPINGNGEVEVTDASKFPDPSGFPTNNNLLTVCVFDGTPEQVTSNTCSYTRIRYQARDGNLLKGCFNSTTHTTDFPAEHTFAQSLPVCGETWFGVPLKDGYTLSYHAIRGYNDSFLYLDGPPNPLANFPFYDGTYKYRGYIQPDTFYWTVLQSIGNTIRWEVWDHDPDTGGTFMIAMRIDLGTASQAAFGATVSGGCGPFGAAQPSPNSYVDWHYE